jgi:hypothetical protein
MIESAILRCGPGNPHALILQVGQVARLHESANVQKRWLAPQASGAGIGFQF